MSAANVPSRPGLTLLEALVALILVSLGGLQAMAVVGAAREAENRAMTTLEAAVLADDVITRIRLGLIKVDDALDSPPQAFAAPFDAYHWTVRPDSSAAWSIQVLRVSVTSGNLTVQSLVAGTGRRDTRLMSAASGQ